ncbi:hypothetical protein KIN20_026940 [Parelaphostrongylus tenuis]|uniref:Uncharacterized protein n=1 Tax=Parelaphostrongylus tenuis TaxID=148309 RepID=A0AAD5QYN6_PARTN|nr:hypothetical protein KIN20_026940 [Parelaphostrongylus tenuis]
MPAGQANTRIFTVTGFTLPVAMVYTGEATVSSQVSGIASNKGGAQTLVRRLVMQAVFDVLESQARSVLLSDAVIAAILGQLTVNIAYEPLECKKVALKPDTDMRLCSVLIDCFDEFKEIYQASKKQNCDCLRFEKQKISEKLLEFILELEGNDIVAFMLEPLKLVIFFAMVFLRLFLV